MGLLVNRAKANTSTVGTGTLSLGSGVVPFQAWSTALGILSGRTYSYLIEDGTSWEVGEGVYTSGAPDTLTRTLIESSTGSLLNLSGSATVACVANARDLQTETLIGSADLSGLNTISFSNLPTSGFKDLRVVFRGRGATAATSENILIQFNGDTTAANYERVRWGTANGGTSVTSSSANDMIMGVFPASTATANKAGNVEATIYDFLSAFHKNYYSKYSGRLGTAIGNYNGNHLAGTWANTAPITSITFPTLSGNNYASGSSISLYAMR